MDTVMQVRELLEGSMFAVILMLVLGILNCFLGYKLLKFWIFFFGVALGGIVGFFPGIHFSSGNINVGIAGAIVCASLIGVLSFKLYLAGIFIVCFIIATILSYIMISPGSSALFVVCILSGVAVGVIGVKFVRPVVIISTGIHGGLIIGTVLITLFGISKNEVGLVAGSIVAFLGIVAQFATTKKNKEEDGGNEIEQE